MDNTASSTEETSAALLSNLGRFCWAVVGSTGIPCLFREDYTKYVPVRLVHEEVHSQFFEKLTQEVLNICWPTAETFYLTKVESDLLNDINKEHCELIYGETAFKENDMIVKLDDLIQCYNFLDTSYNMLLSERCCDTRAYKCGFLRINDDNNAIVPYVIKNNRKYLPIFYFDGETKNLEAEAVTLENMDLAYLKLCCKAQGIKDDLMVGDKCYVTTLEQIKSYFTKDTKFDEFWPADALKTLQSTSCIDSRGQASAETVAKRPSSRVDANSNYSRGQLPSANSARVQQSASRVEANGNHSQGQAPSVRTAGMPPRVEAKSNHSQGAEPAVGTAGTFSRVDDRSYPSQRPAPAANTARTQQSASRVEVDANHLVGRNQPNVVVSAPPLYYSSTVSSKTKNSRDSPQQPSSYLRPQPPPYPRSNFSAATTYSSSASRFGRESSGANAATTNSSSRPYPPVQSMRQSSTAPRYDPRQKWQ